VPESSYLPDISDLTLSPKQDAERRKERNSKISVWQHIDQLEIELCELRNRVATLGG
jgi:hypothetical protein